jgi:single-stranded-DNA-specific exonuclease
MKRWVYAPADRKRAEAVAQALDIALPVAISVVARGYDDVESARRFLEPSLKDISDPMIIPDMPAAVDRLCRALDAREKIVVFGDYDADGVTATALLVRVLRKMGGAVEAFLPHRVDDGYGLSVEAAARCLDQHAPKLVVTVDCGTSAAEAVRLAAARGTDVIVTDHHVPGPERAPACAVVNPKCVESGGAARDLAGVGVAFKLCYAIARQTRALSPEDLQRHLDLVAVGTVADVVPLTGENRILVKHGLQRLSSRGVCLGLQALKRTAGIKTSVDAWHIGYLLGPRLNAAGRLDSAWAALKLLLSDDPDECAHLADGLDAANRERQQIEQKLVDEVVAEWDCRFDESSDFAIVADGQGWHPGVIGIVAARLCRRYYRPAIVISMDPESGEARGSCRSIEGFDMVAHLSKCADLLERYGGHAMAAGLDIRKDRIPAFRERFNEAAAATLRGHELRAPIRVDAAINLSDITEKFIADAARIEPCGVGNPKPLWAVHDIRSRRGVRILKDAHVEMQFEADGRLIRAIGFDMAKRGVPDGALDIVFDARLNTYWGTSLPELHLIDFRSHAAGS